MRQGLLTRQTAERIHGVMLNASGAPDEQATTERRRRLRRERIERADMEVAPPYPPALDPSRPWRTVLRFHEYLDLVRDGGDSAIRCRQCGRPLCAGDQNYDEHAARRKDLEEFAAKRIPNGQPYKAVHQEYACPGCSTLLAVDVLCPTLGDPAPLWDIHIDTSKL